MATLTVDFEAQAAYLHISDAEVVETCEAGRGVLVDLDKFRMAVGIEVLSLSAQIPVDEIARKYHVRREDLVALDQIRPDITTFVARQSVAPVRLRPNSQVKPTFVCD